MTHRQTVSPKQHILATDGFEPGLPALFGLKLKEARREASLTPSARAESAELMRHYVAKIVHDPINPALATMASVARVQSMAVPPKK
jgi:DNA-binding XRE family transcriptional regulator